MGPLQERALQVKERRHREREMSREAIVAAAKSLESPVEPDDLLSRAASQSDVSDRMLHIALHMLIDEGFLSRTGDGRYAVRR